MCNLVIFSVKILYMCKFFYTFAKIFEINYDYSGLYARK
jgi:hypothetical protein